MTDDLVLHGYEHSVYTWIARMTLAEAGQVWRDAEINPFEPMPAGFDAVHPFGRVPVLVHGSFAIYETAALTRYVAARFGDGALLPTGIAARARMDQVIGIVDSYGYVPLVRQVFSHAVFRPWAGEPCDPDVVNAGLRAALRVLRALEDIAQEGLVLNLSGITLADCHVAPMISYFAEAGAGRTALSQFPALDRWMARVEHRPAFAATRPRRGTKPA